MPASRKKTKPSISYNLLKDETKKLLYFKSHLAEVAVASVKGGEIRSGDCVIVDISQDDSGTLTTEDNVCIAQVRDLRIDQTKGGEIYALIRWFYTGPMLRRLSKPKPRVENLSDLVFSPRELILSDHEQVFPTTQMLQKVVVRVFNETAAEQPVIGAGDWWYRYFWPIKNKRLLTADHTELPQPQCAMASACIKKHYTPHREYQHYCPRDSCHRWYHRSCLAHAELEPDPTNVNAKDRLVLMLRGTPGFEWIELGDDGSDTKFFEQLKICLPFIKGIVACAQNSIVRGKAQGVVGNFNAVNRARALLVEARVTDLWPSEAEIKEFAEWAFLTENTYRCKNCDGAI